jgi:hypothetical protein
MSVRQKWIIGLFVLVNVVILGVIGLLLVLNMAQPETPTQTALQEATLPPTATVVPSPTFTRTPIVTRTPKPTQTLVVQGTPILLPPPPTLAPRILANGWQQYVFARDGFEFSTPPEWLYLDLTTDDREILLSEFLHENPRLDQAIGPQARRAAAEGIKFLAFDLQGDAALASITVSFSELPEHVSSRLIAQQLMFNVQQLSTLERAPVERIVKLEAGSVSVVEYAVKLNDPNMVNAVAVTQQYIFVHEQDLCIVALSTLEDYDQEYSAVFDQMSNSFHWLDK